jgi:hypothetical protein
MEELKKFTLPALLERVVSAYPENPALAMVDGNPIRYRELQSQVVEVGLLLRQMGVVAGAGGGNLK